MNRNRSKTPSQIFIPVDDELSSIERHYEFVNMTFKYSINDLDNIIQMLSARFTAEEAYLNALLKVKRLNFSSEDRHISTQESQLTFQKAVKSYEVIIDDIIESRSILKERIKLEIDVLTRQRETEERMRKSCKAKLSESNSNYNIFRTRDIVKLQRSYYHRCEDLKQAVSAYELQQQAPFESTEYSQYTKSNRNSGEFTLTSRLSSEMITKDLEIDPPSKKGMVSLLSQMRTRATGNLSPMDQTKQIAKIAKIKKDIVDMDHEYRDGVLRLEVLRKKQIKIAEEANRQLKKTIQKKTDIVKKSLSNILLSESESLTQEMNITRLSYDAASNIDSFKDLQVFDSHYQSQCYIKPTPVHYKNFYFEGECKEVLFGSMLETYALEHSRTVPSLVVQCCEAIEQRGLHQEGIYRMSGRQVQVELLKHQFELDEDNVNLDDYDVFTIATVLKLYIRELKRPLFDLNGQNRIHYNNSIPQVKRFQMLEIKLADLSLAHRSTLCYLTRHLAKINANYHINKMNITNLAILFAPVIFHQFTPSNEENGYPNDLSYEDIIEDLILHQDMLFSRAEDMARKSNEFKLNQALQGLSPFDKNSQSNLLYLLQNREVNLINPSPPSVKPMPTPAPMSAPMPVATTPTANMLLTQPMTPPIYLNEEEEEPTQNYYPIEPPLVSPTQNSRSPTGFQHFVPATIVMTNITSGAAPATVPVIEPIHRYQPELSSLSDDDTTSPSKPYKFVLPRRDSINKSIPPHRLKSSSNEKFLIPEEKTLEE